MSIFPYKDYKKLFQNGEYLDALLIIRSLSNSRNASLQYLEDYVDCTLLAYNNELITDVSPYLLDIKNKLDNITSYLRLTRERTEQVLRIQSKIDQLSRIVDENNKVNIETLQQKISQKNSDILQALKGNLSNLENCSNESEFTQILNNVKKLEKALDSESFSDEESALYDSLIDDYAETVQKLTDVFNKKALKDYNIMALESIHECFDEFIKNKRNFIKHFDDSKQFLEDKLLSLDVNKLFKETNDYYNYVYSFIFNRLDNKDKYTLSKMVLEVNKK